MSGKRAEVDEVLIELGFAPADKFGAFVTYGRMSLNIHVGPIEAFAAFGADDEILGEGSGERSCRTLPKCGCARIRIADFTRDGR